jgi:hypothetical protein
VDSSGRLLLTGYFRRIAGQPAPGITRLMPAGQLDPDFFPGTGFSDSGSRVILALPDGDYLALPVFEYNSLPVGQIVRLIGDP